MSVYADGRTAARVEPYAAFEGNRVALVGLNLTGDDGTDRWVEAFRTTMAPATAREFARHMVALADQAEGRLPDGGPSMADQRRQQLKELGLLQGDLL